ncbi:MAG TPA: SMC-Scp complex subunit ScpB [Microlunatus sp.]
MTEQDQSQDAALAFRDTGVADPEPEVATDDALIEAPPSRSPEELQSALEALLMIADEPVSETTLAAALNTPTGAVADALAELVKFYDETGRGFELRSVAGGWRYYTRDQHAELLGSYVLQGQQAKLSQAALETLAVIAYMQPVSRSRVSAVRGVSVDGVMRTLLTRELIAEIGSEDSGATLFSTTDYFLERMGLQSLDDLPELAPYLPEATDLEAELGQLAVVPDPEQQADADPELPPDVAAETSTDADSASGPESTDSLAGAEQVEGPFSAEVADEQSAHSADDDAVGRTDDDGAPEPVDEDPGSEQGLR